MSNRPEDSRGRWWEIQGEVQLDEGGPRELMTDSRGRSRPERSLSVGVDLADEPGHPARAFLWPIVSAVAAVGLIVSVVYVVKDKSAAPASAAPPEATAPGRVHDEAGVKQDPSGVKPVEPRVPLGGPSAAGGFVQPLTGSWGGPPRGPVGNSGAPANIPSAPATAPGSPGSTSSGSSGAATGEAGNQPSGPPPSSVAAAPQYPPVKLDGTAPAAPRSRQARTREPETGSCKIFDSNYYSCNIAHDAPVYLPETRKPTSSVRPGDYPFLCQSAGSKYSVGDRTNHWWAWLSVPFTHFAFWVPVVFLTGGPDNTPEPGLPVCDSSATASAGGEPASTTAPVPTSTSSAPTTTRKRPSS